MSIPTLTSSGGYIGGQLGVYAPSILKVVRDEGPLIG